MITSYHVVSSSSSSLVVSTARCCVNCQITRIFFCPCMREERERDVFSRSLVEREDDDQSYERRRLSLSECVSLLSFFVLPLSLSGERITWWMIATTNLFLCVFFVIIKTGGRLDGHLGFFRGERFSSTAVDSFSGILSNTRCRKSWTRCLLLS